MLAVRMQCVCQSSSVCLELPRTGHVHSCVRQVQQSPKLFRARQSKRFAQSTKNAMLEE